MCCAEPGAPLSCLAGCGSTAQAGSHAGQHLLYKSSCQRCSSSGHAGSFTADQLLGCQWRQRHGLAAVQSWRRGRRPAKAFGQYHLNCSKVVQKEQSRHNTTVVMMSVCERCYPHLQYHACPSLRWHKHTPETHTFVGQSQAQARHAQTRRHTCGCPGTTHATLHRCGAPGRPGY